MNEPLSFEIEQLTKTLKRNIRADDSDNVNAARMIRALGGMLSARYEKTMTRLYLHTEYHRDENQDGGIRYPITADFIDNIVSACQNVDGESDPVDAIQSVNTLVNDVRLDVQNSLKLFDVFDPPASYMIYLREVLIVMDRMQCMIVAASSVITNEKLK